jgi:hypothetical protein
MESRFICGQQPKHFGGAAWRRTRGQTVDGHKITQEYVTQAGANPATAFLLICHKIAGFYTRCVEHV